MAIEVSSAPIEQTQQEQFAEDINQAIQSKQIARFTALYDKAPNSVPPYNLASFIIYKGTLEMLQYAVDKGLDIHLRDGGGYTLLHGAVTFDRPKFVRYLIKAGLDINVKADDGIDLVDMCASSSENMLNTLLELGLHINKKENHDMVNKALNYYNVSMAQYFIDQGYELNPEIFQETDYLSEVMRQESVEILDFLLAHGLETESTVNLHGATLNLLQFAAQIKSKDIVSTLLKHGASPDAENVLEWAIIGKQTQIALQLIEYGANPETLTQTQHSMPMLHLALDHKRTDIALALIRAGADIHQRDDFNKRNALHFAAALGDVDILKMLIDRGGKVHELDISRKAPLDIARINHHQDAVNYLEKIEAEQPGRR